MARVDPVEIIAKVSEDNGKQRAFEVWQHKAVKAGWPVTVESATLDQPGPECGVVEIEGLRYTIRHDRRVRQMVAGAWEFTHAAWAEPALGPV